MVPFSMNVPNQEMQFTITAEVNKSRKYKESTYSNNKLSTTAVIQELDAPNGCVKSVTWTKYYSKSSKPSGGSVIKRHYKSYTNSEGVRKKKLVGYTVKFKASLSLSASLEKSSLKAGYGTNAYLTARVSTNATSGVSPIQSATFYANDGTKIKMERIEYDSDSLTSKFQLPANSKSHYGENKHYIPRTWNDGSYEIVIKGFGASTPGGYLYCNEDLTLTIKGDMYEDDHSQ